MSDNNQNQGQSQLMQIYGLVHTLAFLFAIYLSFKCEKSFNLGSFLAACCCPYIYIVFIMSTRKQFCS